MLGWAGFGWERSVSWNKQLGKDWRGSRPRCVLLMDGEREEVAARLTELVDLPDVLVSPTDTWMPSGKSAPTEIELDKADGLLLPEIQRELGQWWLAVGIGKTRTPVWDIASTCNIKGKQGLILVEAKAHENELSTQGKKLDNNASENSQKNHEQIGGAIIEANRELQSEVGGEWNLSRDSHYQISNRFAWSWKLASLGTPVVLVYLGFLRAYEMTDRGDPFHYLSEWESSLKAHVQGKVNSTAWGKCLYIGEARIPFIPLIRAYNQHFDPKKP